MLIFYNCVADIKENGFVKDMVDYRISRQARIWITKQNLQNYSLK